MKKLKEAERSTIAGIFLFKGADPLLVEKALGMPGCEALGYKKGMSVYEPESYRRSLGIVLSGSLKVGRDIDEGHRLIISSLEKGSVFGAAALFNDYDSYVNELVAEKDSRVFFIPQESVVWLMMRDFRAAENYIRYLSERLHFLSGKISSLSAGSAEKKLFGYVAANAEAGEDGSLRLRLKGSMNELAGVLNIGRASLYRALDSLERSGAIKKEGRLIYLLEPDYMDRGHNS